VHWVEPHLVAQVAFTGWTEEGVLRHPSFKGLREDKAASEVTREVPEPPPGPAKKPAKTRAKAATKASPAKRAAASKRTASKRAPAKPAAAPAPKRTAPATSSTAKPARRGTAIEVAGVRITNPDRVLYPEQGLTKLELVQYYERVADRILPYLQGRPLALVRCPGGRDKGCFYQKHIAEGVPAELVAVPVVEQSGEHAVYVAVESLQGLLLLPQMGVLEVHPWGSRRQHLASPDVLIFDLDPGPGVAWTDVIGAARDLRQLLRELGLESYPKLSGGKGVHLVVPIVPELQWNAAKAFTHAVVELLAKRDPDRYVTTMAKAKRAGSIFLDYLRNGFGNTAVAPYSTRARPNAPVAAPVRWEELGPKLKPDHYTVRNLGRRLSTLRRDPWDGFFTLQQRVPRAVLKQLGAG